MCPCCSNCRNDITGNLKYLCCRKAYGIDNLAFPPIRNKQGHTSVRGTGKDQKIRNEVQLTTIFDGLERVETYHSDSKKKSVYGVK
jgi:hypothetical protein